MAKPNYRHAKKQKEAARKARQEAKQQRRANTGGPAGSAEIQAEAESVAAVDQGAASLVKTQA